MSEPKLTVGRVETWRPIDYREEIYQRGDLPENFVLRLTAAINERMAALAPPAPQPKACATCGGDGLAIAREAGGTLCWTVPCPDCVPPQPEAKAEPDYTCPKCGAKNHHTPTYFSMCGCDPWAVLAAANARIAELVRERDEARAVPASWHTARRIEDAYEEGRLNGEAAGYAKGAAAAKEACAKAVEAKADAENPFWFSVANMVARTIRETEGPDA